MSTYKFSSWMCYYIYS